MERWQGQVIIYQNIPEYKSPKFPIKRNRTAEHKQWCIHLLPENQTLPTKVHTDWRNGKR